MDMFALETPLGKDAVALLGHISRWGLISLAPGAHMGSLCPRLVKGSCSWVELAELVGVPSVLMGEGIKGSWPELDPD
jgi:hypothetical protein